MKRIDNYSYDFLIKLILGQTVHFTSDCEFFPNFNITGKVISYSIKSNELIFSVKELTKQKILTVGTNMKNLKFEII